MALTLGGEKVFHQSGLEYFGTFKIPSEVEVEQLKRMSPISHVASVDKPTQLHVGMKDRRGGVKAEVLCYLRD